MPSSGAYVVATRSRKTLLIAFTALGKFSLTFFAFAYKYCSLPSLLTVGRH